MASKSRSLLRYALLGAGGLLLVLLLAVAVCWVAGGGVHTQTTSAQINAPQEVVFKHLTDPESIKKWIEGVEEIQPLDDLGNKPGARSRVVCIVDGEPFEMEEEMLTYNESDELSIRLTSPMFSIVNIYKLTADGEQTTITQTMESEYHGMARPMAPFIQGATQQQLDKNIAALKELAEED